LKRFSSFSIHLADVDGRLHGLDLAEEQLMLTFGVLPVLQEPRRRARYADEAAAPPEPDPRAHPVDKVVFLDAVARPFGIEGDLLRLLPRLGDRDEV